MHANVADLGKLWRSHYQSLGFRQPDTCKRTVTVSIAQQGRTSRTKAVTKATPLRVGDECITTHVTHIALSGTECLLLGGAPSFWRREDM
jgi:hypothetical protein